MFKFAVYILILITCFSLTAQGVHVRDLESHIYDKPLVSFGNPSKVPMSFSSVYTPVTDKLVFGYLPYWANSTDNLRYGLLTDILYFSCELSANGALGDCHDWPGSAPIDEAHKYGVRMHLSRNKDCKRNIHDF